MKLFIITGLLTIVYFSLFSQSKKELEIQRRKTQDEIEYANNLLKSTQKERKKSVEDYIITNKKIEVRLLNIKQISNEIKKIENDIINEQVVIDNLSSDLIQLRQEYERLIYQSYKTKHTNDKLMYIFSSKDFDQAFRRIKYLNRYSSQRKKQIKSIESTKLSLEQRILSFEELKKEKSSLISEIEFENKTLSKEKNQQEKLLDELSQKEKQLKVEISKKERIARDLNNRIQKIIAEEIQRSKNGSKVYQLTPEEKLVDNKFSSNIKRLPWPLERGIITEHFGEHNHPILSGIKTRNDGIDISTVKSSFVRTVFDGTVRNVFIVPGMNKVVIIRHGSYLSVYSNLIDVFVKPGENVKTKQNIGVLATDDKSEFSTLKFQIWKENEKLDPEKWLTVIK